MEGRSPQRGSCNRAKSNSIQWPASSRSPTSPHEMSPNSPPVAPQKTHANPRCCHLLNVHSSTRKSCTHTSKCNGSSGAGVAANVGAATTGCTTTAASCLAQTGTVLPPPVVGLGASTRTPDSANFPLLRHLAASLLRVRRRRGQVTVAHLGRVGGPGRVRGRACLNACSCKHGRAYHEIVKLTLTQCIRMPQRPHADSGPPPPTIPAVPLAGSQPVQAGTYFKLCIFRVPDALGS